MCVQLSKYWTNKFLTYQEEHLQKKSLLEQNQQWDLQSKQTEYTTKFSACMNIYTYHLTSRAVVDQLL